MQLIGNMLNDTAKKTLLFHFRSYIFKPIVKALRLHPKEQKHDISTFDLNCVTLTLNGDERKPHGTFTYTNYCLSIPHQLIVLTLQFYCFMDPKLVQNFSIHPLLPFYMK